VIRAGQQPSEFRVGGPGAEGEFVAEVVGGLLGEPDGGGVLAGGQQRVGDGAEQGAQDDRVAGAFGGGEAAVGGGPGKVGLAVLRQRLRGGLIGQREQPVRSGAVLTRVLAGGELRGRQDGRQLAGDPAEPRLLVGGPQVGDLPGKHVERRRLTGFVAAEETGDLPVVHERVP
jgi:hypothetical protein